MIQGKAKTQSQREVAVLSDLLPAQHNYDHGAAFACFRDDKKCTAAYWGAQEYILGWRVVRLFMMRKQPHGQYHDAEVVQVWERNGERYIASRNRVVMSTWYCDSWYINDGTMYFRNRLRNLDEDLNLKYNCGKAFEHAFYYASTWGTLGICLKRKETETAKPLNWIADCEKIVSRLTKKKAEELYAYSPHYETLYKAGMTKLIKALAKRGLEIDRYWRSIKICIRNHYDIKNPELWLRYIDNLRIEKKDLCSPKWVCPEDLRAANDTIEKRISRWAHNLAEEIRHREEQERVQRELEEANREKAKLQVWEDKAKYLGVQWNCGEYTIRPLQSIAEYKYEADMMHHCVFRMKYWSKLDSIILTVRDKDNIPVQTCELNLLSGRIMQIYGAHDHTTALTEPLKEDIANHAYLFTNITYGEEKTA